MKNLTVKPMFRPFACGCIPYVDTQSYEGWHQFGLQVPRGVKGQKPIRVSDGKPGRESLWCQCVVRPQQPRTQRATAVAPPEIVVREHSNGPAVARIPIEAVATSPAEVAVQPATTVDHELYETALKVQHNVEASLLDDMLSPQEPEVVTVAAHPLTKVLPQQERRVRTITNKTVLEERAIRRDTPRAPQTRTARPNTNEISAAPEGAMSLAAMCEQLAK